ncbi:MAG: MarR family transcriptional regulator [Pseudomonadales bacterium]|jgi:DNA-binding MarR family transcriptional regulator|nr:MarR family transcriptional regulator [Pseudomonadales bacterium]
MVEHPDYPRLLQCIELFYFAYRSFTSVPDRILQEKGLGRVHHRILYFVGRNPGININELLQILAVSKQALNAPLRKLTNQGLIEAETASHDRRVKQLRLSKSGARLETRLTNAQMEHLARAFASTDKNALECWMRIMQAMPKAQ